MCSDDVNECITMTSLCPSSRTECSNTEGGYECTCIQGWRGKACEEDVNECEQGLVTCENGGTCINTPGEFIDSVNS